MLELKKNVTRSPDGTQCFIEVVEATGLYNVDSNPGGFGPPNPARNVMALLFYGNYKLSADDQLAVANLYDAMTVGSFTLPIVRATNGHLNFYVFAVNKFDIGGVYVDGDIVYDVENPAVPFVKKKVGGVWIVITIPDLIPETSVVRTEGNVFIIPSAEQYENELSANAVKLLRAYVNGEFQEDKYQPARNDYDFVEGLLENAVNLFCRGAYAEAQLLLEEILAFEDDRKAA